jgi:hypothetical protein
MASNLNNQGYSQSRRRLFKWLGQVTAGITVAGIGLNASTLPKAQAAQNEQLSAVDPHYVPCPTCHINSCDWNFACWLSYGNIPYEMFYTSYEGRQPNCQGTQHNQCVSTCSRPPC